MAALNSTKNWLGRIKGLVHRPSPTTSSTQSAAAPLIEYLTEQISDAARAASVMASVSHFLELSTDQQTRELPNTYLLLEKYLVEVDPNRLFTQEKLRAMVKSRYAGLLEQSHFGLIFESISRQELLLCRLLLLKALEGSIAVVVTTLICPTEAETIS